MANSQLTLTTALVRLRNFLVDSGDVIWSDETLTEGLRLALGDIRRVVGCVVVLNGLDFEAPEDPRPDYVPPRFLDERDEDLLIRGAGGYAARSRVVDRAEMVSIVAGQPDGLAEWGERELENFQEGVEAVRRRGLQSAVSGPAGVWGWDEGRKGW